MLNYVRPRIRLTNYCNRKCTYCFAQDYIMGQKNNSHLSLKEIEDVIKKCLDNNIMRVAWQGGEPLIHKDIFEIIQLHCKYDMEVDIFTNGIFDSNIIKELKKLNFSMLLNLNHPDTYKPKQYETIRNNLKIMQENNLIDKVALGLNVYEEKQEINFFLDMIKSFNIQEVRVDLVRPSMNSSNKYYGYEDVKKVFPYLKEIIAECKKVGVKYPHFDCPLPLCELSDEDALFFWKHSVNTYRIGKCFTHVDIMQNLEVASCFCSLEFNNINLLDFKNFNECRDFIKYCEDYYRWDNNMKEECSDCILKKERICQGGCLGYNKNNDKIVINKDFLHKYKKNSLKINRVVDIPRKEYYNNLFKNEDNIVYYLKNTFIMYEVYLYILETKINLDDRLIALCKEIINKDSTTFIEKINLYFTYKILLIYNEWIGDVQTKNSILKKMIPLAPIGDYHFLTEILMKGGE